MEKFLKYNIIPQIDETDPNKATIIIDNLEKGFAQTLGNSLRRIALSNIPGISMFAIKIPGVTHEFQALDYVEEDVIEIILNLKKLVIKFNGTIEEAEALNEKTIEQWPTLKISMNGPCVITAANIQCPPEFEIVNKDLIIATITGKKEFEMQIYAKLGRGFKTSDENKESLNVLSVIPTDSNFSPVTSFNYKDEEIKMSKISTNDRLTIDLTTNGSISSSDAIAMAAHILSSHLKPLIDIDKRIEEYNIFQEEQSKPVNDLAFISIEELDLSVRAYNALKSEGIHTTLELLDRTKNDIQNIKNLGRKSVDEIIDAVHRRNLKLKDE